MFADETAKGPFINDIVSEGRVGGHGGPPQKRLLQKTHVLIKQTTRGWSGEKS